MKKIIVTLTVLCLVFVSTSIVNAQSEDEILKIYLDYTDGTVYASASDYLVLRHAWGACTQGLLNLYLNAVHTEIDINGEILSTADGNNQFWLPMYLNPDVNVEPYCIAGGKKGLWTVAWEYPLGKLQPGEYEISYKNWFDHKITDGSDSDEDGLVDHWEGIFQDKTFTIIVE